MAKTVGYSSSVLGLLLNGTSITNVAMNTTSTPLTSCYVALHTADPTAVNTGGQAQNEIAYTGYARVAVARSTGTAAQWTISTGTAGATAVPVSAITFPQGTGATGGTATYWSVGSTNTGAGTIYYSGAISPAIICGTGVTPILTTASNITES
jgi:hypothetical protein